MNDNPLLNNKYISLGFFRCEASAYKYSLNTNPFIFIDNNAAQKTNVEVKNLLCWGYSDILTIFLFNSPQNFIDLQKIYPSNNKIYEDSYNSGILIQPQNLQDLSKINELPLVGISFIKLNDKLFEGVKKDNVLGFIENHIWSEIQKLIKKTESIFPLLVLSYGWEDLILLLFANRYDSIKELIFKLRKNLTFLNAASLLEPNFASKYRDAKHIITTTYTIFATYLPSSNIDESLKILNEKIDKQDKMLVDKIYFQIRPGHLDYVAEEIKNYDKISILQFMPGRYDLAVKLENTNIYDLLNFYLKKVWPILESKGNPIISTQTFFGLNKDKEPMEECIPCKNPIQIEPIPEDEKDFIRSISNSVWLPSQPSHSAIGLGNTLISSWYLKHSFFIKGVMKSLTKFIDAMKDSIRKPNDGDLREAAEEILPLLSLCFLDRFRGTYPLGEGFSMPLINYKGSFQKQLIFVDYASFIIFETIRECLNHFGENIKKHYFCSFIGTRFSPAITSFVDYNYNLAILQIPLDSFFNSRELYYLFHEVGHTLLRSKKMHVHISSRIQYLSEILSEMIRPDENAEIRIFEEIPIHEFEEIKRIILEEIQRLSLDILSDYIMLVAGFRGNLEDSEKFLYDYARKISHRNDDKVVDEIKFRASVIEKLFSYHSDIQKLLAELESLKNMKLEDENWRAYVVLSVYFLSKEISDNSELFNFVKNISKLQTIKDQIPSYPVLENITLYMNSLPISNWLEIYKDYFCNDKF